MSFGRRSGFFQPKSRFIAGSSSTQTVTITRSIVNTSAVSFTFTNAGLPNTNIGYNIIGVDSADFTDSSVTGQVTLDATGTATLIKTITPSEDVGVDKSFYVSAYTVNNRITGQSANVNINTITPFSASGGNSFTQSGNVFHVFTGNGNLTVSQIYSGPASLSQIRTLIVAQGGHSDGTLSGAGAGGLINANVNANTFTITTYPITVGNAAYSSGANGANTTFAGYTAVGGGGGVGIPNNGKSGGSGSGAAYAAGTVPGNGTSGQGNRGGYAAYPFTTRPGAGGGAGAVGGNAFNSGGTWFGGIGGAGALVDWVPTGYGDPSNPNYFAGGGSAGFGQTSTAVGVNGPGGGGGGGTGASFTGKAGIVILSYPALSQTRYLNLP